ncbi:aspartic peptidase domain-containing protein [Cokeromyces recurvatus]|uniref:aspartic peptidase domain-containing protein n=1 Tax=Cokeromyces recurvatus TaxID=90255 RepID=UPI0022207461|nr:aspartic peptidase domain-containing protein [Cokeromyces recurvatus]KAI7898545.1 aspartic peptidase domain-containing protein [Cokeromyces recurvatus]
MRTAFLCLAAFAQLALNAVSADPINIPLYKRSDSGAIYKAAGKALENGVLAGKVKIGNPPQEFTVAFDTTTGYSWVRGSRCKTKNCRGRCSYYALKSSDVVSTGKKFSVEYGDSCVDTHVYLDTFEFSNLTVKNMPFGGAYRMSGFANGFDGYLGLGRSVDFNFTKIRSTASNSLSKRDVTLPDSAFVSTAFQQGSGITSAQFGIYTTSTNAGFDQSGTTPVTSNTGNIANTNTTPPPGSNINTNTTTTDTTVDTSGSVTDGGFGALTKRNNHAADTEEEEPAGYLILGGVDKSIIKGKMEYIRLADNPGAKAKNWDVCIRHASFGPLRFRQQPNAIASVSTSTSFISMPPDQADAFHAKFGGQYQPSKRNYAIKCSKAAELPLLKMTLEDHIVELPAKYWIAVVDADRDCCETKITRGNSERDWVLGTSLINAFYTSFDPENEAIGLAIKKGHSNDGLRVYKKSH